MSSIQGFTTGRFHRLREAFVGQFQQGREIGAALAVYHRGKLVVDLVGGYRNAERTEPWTDDTLVPLSLTSGGLAALALAVTHSRGTVDYESAVADYWPQFATGGKQEITVRQLISHQAGLCRLDGSLDQETPLHRRVVRRLLLAQRPSWQPGSRQGYHATSLGWYLGEMLRSINPQWKSLGRWVQDTLAAPLGLELHVDSISSRTIGRVAQITGRTIWDYLSHWSVLPWRLVLAMLTPGSLAARTMHATEAATHIAHEAGDLGTTPLLPTLGLTKARDLAHAFSEFAGGGRKLDVDRRTLGELQAPSQAPSRGRFDAVLKTETSYGLGVWKPFEQFQFGSGSSAFAATDLGGSLVFADPAAELAMAYTPNRMSCHLFNDPRQQVLRETVMRCVA